MEASAAQPLANRRVASGAKIATITTDHASARTAYQPAECGEQLARLVAERQRPDGADHHRDRLVLGDRLHPAGHRLDRHVGARHEHQREGEERHAIGGLGVARDETHVDERPREREPEDEAQRDRHDRIDGRAVEPEPGEEPDGDGDEQAPRDQRRVGDRPAEQDRRPRDRQRPQPVEQARCRRLRRRRRQRPSRRSRRRRRRARGSGSRRS